MYRLKNISKISGKFIEKNMSQKIEQKENVAKAGTEVAVEEEEITDLFMKGEGKKAEA